MHSQSENNFISGVSAIQRLLSQVKPSTSTSLKSFIVGLFTGDDQNPLRFSEKIGLLQLDFDRSFKTHFLRFYDIDSLRLMVELELYYGFGENYRNHEYPTLYIFDFFSEGVIGFSFRNQEEAKIMEIKIKSVSPKIQELREYNKQQIRQQIELRKSKTFFGKLKKKFQGKPSVKAPQYQESEIIEVERSKSIQFNLDTGQFDLNNIPPEWEEIFSSLNLTKQDLQNKEIAEVIIEETIIHQAKKNALQNPQTLEEKHRQSNEKSTIMTSSFESSVEEIPKKTLNEEKHEVIVTSIGPQNQEKKVVEPSRNQLLEQIRNNKLKLRPVKTTEKGIHLDASSMNRESRKDLAEQIRIKLQKRKLALQRRNGSEESDSD